MNDSMNEELIATAELGDEARRFLEGDLGRCLLGMAQQEVLMAEKALGKIDPNDKDGITLLQRQVWLGEHFEQWLIELISKGENALEVFRHEQET